MSDPLFIVVTGMILIALMLLTRSPRRHESREARSERGKQRYVYVIARLDRRGRAIGPTKVGIAGNPEARLKTFQTANPHPLVLYRTFRVTHARALEHDVHRRLRPFRLKGEWFALSPERTVTAVHLVLNRPRRGLIPAWHRLALWWHLRRAGASETRA